MLYDEAGVPTLMLTGTALSRLSGPGELAEGNRNTQVVIYFESDLKICIEGDSVLFRELSLVDDHLIVIGGSLDSFSARGTNAPSLSFNASVVDGFVGASAVTGGGAFPISYSAKLSVDIGSDGTTGSLVVRCDSA